MKLYTFEIDTIGKCEIEVEASSDAEAVKKLIDRDFVSKTQIESNLDFPNISTGNISEAMDYCYHTQELTEKEASDEDRILNKELG